MNGTGLIIHFYRKSSQDIQKTLGAKCYSLLCLAYQTLNFMIDYTMHFQYTVSPGLFTHYLSDFHPPPNVDDLSLSGHYISNIEEADYVALFMLHEVCALQGKLDYMHLDWCAENFLIIGPLKVRV